VATNSSSSNLLTGLVERTTGSFYRVRFCDGTVKECVLRGKIRLNDLDSTNPVAVGDFVDVLLEADSHVIQSIAKRENYLIRRATKSSATRQILCANIDQAVIVFTLEHPHTPIGFLDSFLVTAGAYHIPVIIVLNKIDTLRNKKQQQLEEFVVLYQSLGYRVEMLSALDYKYHDLALEILADKRSFVAGRSGSGKSTFVNLADPQLNLRTASVSTTNRYGRHTTTFAELFWLNCGGWVIDAPGVREFHLTDIEPNEVSHYFPEMLILRDGCRFTNCLHTSEPDCAVLNALEDGLIAETRYNSYLMMLDELGSIKH
jgi:ribosome biogenesis GTPase